jgi:hypothetical protein
MTWAFAISMLLAATASAQHQIVLLLYLISG